MRGCPRGGPVAGRKRARMVHNASAVVLLLLAGATVTTCQLGQRPGLAQASRRTPLLPKSRTKGNLTTSTSTRMGGRLRVCMCALYLYEHYSLIHHLVYHEMVGVSSAWVYFDDRMLDETGTRRGAEHFARKLRRLRPFVRVLWWSKEKIARQRDVLSHCTRETARLRDVDWLTNFDGDEYLHFGPPQLAPKQSNSSTSSTIDSAMWRPWSTRTVLAAVPSHISGLIMPRLSFTSVTHPGAEPEHAVPPTQLFGNRFFEPAAYTAVPRTVSDGGMPMSACFGKPLMRVGHRAGLIMRNHFLRFDNDRQSGVGYYFAPLTSMLALGHCAGIAGSGPRRLPSGVSPAPSAEAALRSYSALQLYHYVTRSVQECKLKEYHQGHGFSAAGYSENAAHKGPAGRSGHRARRPLQCAVPANETHRVIGLALAANLTLHLCACSGSARFDDEQPATYSLRGAPSHIC